MSAGQRKVVILTGLVVGLLAGSFSFMSWSHANQVAGVFSALLSVAGIGITIWVALSNNSLPGIRVSSTGRASATHGGNANTGFVGNQSAATSISASVESSGDVEAAGGEGNSGIKFQ
ncbi:hypothetical protein [Streptomyces scabiei]|uniref:hypothetical protein n=1 Tax=Streptomyces scabiei TaxID=1930 RepID=UPI001F295BFE|nr:hypothetical protein [Streptomyces scabiei]